MYGCYQKADSTNDGHDAIFCKGTCNSWLHHQCTGLSKPNFDLLHNSEVPFAALTVAFKDTNLSYQTLNQPLATQLQNKVSEVETKLLCLSPNDSMNLDTSGPSLLANRDEIPELTPVNSCISAAVTSIINEEKEKDKRKLNIIVPS